MKKVKQKRLNLFGNEKVWDKKLPRKIPRKKFFVTFNLSIHLLK